MNGYNLPESLKQVVLSDYLPFGGTLYKACADGGVRLADKLWLAGEVGYVWRDKELFSPEAVEHYGEYMQDKDFYRSTLQTLAGIRLLFDGSQSDISALKQTLDCVIGFTRGFSAMIEEYLHKAPLFHQGYYCSTFLHYHTPQAVFACVHTGNTRANKLFSGGSCSIWQPEDDVRQRLNEIVTETTEGIGASFVEHSRENFQLTVYSHYICFAYALCRFINENIGVPSSQICYTVAADRIFKTVILK